MLTPCQKDESHQLPVPPDVENKDDIHQQFNPLGKHHEEGSQVEVV